MIRLSHTRRFTPPTLLAILLAFSSLCASAQQPDILTYIHTGWDTLSRSMTDCKSVIDPKTDSPENPSLAELPATPPTLYLPANTPAPAALSAMQQQCNLQIAHLPRPIHHLAEVSVSEIPKEGLLYLPNPYVVPGGRFNEQYGWDSYFILLGLLADATDKPHHLDLARGMVENFFYEIDHYGALLNANRTYYLSRSQPPFLSSMIREVYEHDPDPTHALTWLQSAYAFATRDYALWTSPLHRAGNTGLARYRDAAPGPVPEMADDSTYYPDVIRWLIAQPATHTAYLIKAPEHPTNTEATSLAKTSCDPRTLKVCATAYADGYRLTAAFFRGDRAMRESGFDTSFRFGPFSGSTDGFAPVCLNSLLYKYETDMQHFAELLHRPREATLWSRRAATRKAAINRLLWHADSGMFYDYNYVAHTASAYNYLSAFYPLWAGLATPQQAAAIEHHLGLFEHEGGLAMSDRNSATQWDLPYGWAPTNWLAVKGLDTYGFHDDAGRIAQHFTRTIEENFARDHTIREKYNVVSGTANIQVATGYKENVVGFGWTNAVYLCMQALLANPPAATSKP